MNAGHLVRLVPGVALCGAIAFAATLLQALQQSLIGRPGLDALVLAILIGIGVRSQLGPNDRFAPGVDFSARTMLEIAVALLGLSVSFAEVARAGLPLPAAIVGVVAVSILSSYGICRLLGIGPRMAILVACGNAICGNSAIVAVAPAIRASSEDVASAITFSAILGVVIVLVLPFMIPLAGLSDYQFGVLAGLTIYAVPQVMAAAVPVSLHAVQVATLVKLIRVLMLGPIVMVMSILANWNGGALAGGTTQSAPQASNAWQMVPLFIPAFLLLAVLRSADVFPASLVETSVITSRLLCVVAMAGLGLCVDMRHILRLSVRLTLAVLLSVGILMLASLAAVRLIGIDS
ncbi:YeiH family protein [Allomesorhizobium alhagi]|uniref:Uncharacterized protein n=1 Tax=Mesorhizobium alhagi CCNWXJ12-2 TaxID=1107882 RepID=H0I1T7_9HYPH|nr:putative sulfate exporter family transporter [Mesorhizobium alhagi]EHK53077.1 hypothetical protein MAXJ12_32124 [Mesorhizobium alhagi CCNWXJ12-2]